MMDLEKEFMKAIFGDKGKWEPTGGLHLPNQEWLCQNCGAGWMEEFDENEEIMCHKCHSRGVVEVKKPRTKSKLKS